MKRGDRDVFKRLLALVLSSRSSEFDDSDAYHVDQTEQHARAVERLDQADAHVQVLWMKHVVLDAAKRNTFARSSCEGFPNLRNSAQAVSPIT